MSNCKSKCNGEEPGFGVLSARVGIPLPGCVILGKFLSPSEPQFCHL